MCLCVSLFLLFAGGLLLWFRCHSYQALDNLVLLVAPLRGKAQTLPTDFCKLAKQLTVLHYQCQDSVKRADSSKSKLEHSANHG